MKILDYDYKTRDYDKKFVVLGKILDHDNKYRYTNEKGHPATYVPVKWITLGVYDLEMTLEN